MEIICNKCANEETEMENQKNIWTNEEAESEYLLNIWANERMTCLRREKFSEAADVVM